MREVTGPGGSGFQIEEYRSGRLVLPALRDWLDAGEEAKSGHTYPLQQLKSQIPGNRAKDGPITLPEQKKQ